MYFAEGLVQVAIQINLRKRRLVTCRVVARGAICRSTLKQQRKLVVAMKQSGADKRGRHRSKRGIKKANANFYVSRAICIHRRYCQPLRAVLSPLIRPWPWPQEGGDAHRYLAPPRGTGRKVVAPCGSCSGWLLPVAVKPDLPI